MIFQFSIFQFVLIEIYLIYYALNSFCNAPLSFGYINFQKITFNLLKFLLKSQFHLKKINLFLIIQAVSLKLFFLVFILNFKLINLINIFLLNLGYLIFKSFNLLFIKHRLLLRLLIILNKNFLCLLLLIKSVHQLMILWKFIT